MTNDTPHYKLIEGIIGEENLESVKGTFKMSRTYFFNDGSKEIKINEAKAPFEYEFSN